MHSTNTHIEVLASMFIVALVGPKRDLHSTNTHIEVLTNVRTRKVYSKHVTSSTGQPTNTNIEGLAAMCIVVLVGPERLKFN